LNANFRGKGASPPTIFYIRKLESLVKKIAENFNRLSRVHQRHRQTDDRQTTDGTAMAYSEREREFTFAKKGFKMSKIGWFGVVIENSTIRLERIRIPIILL